MVEPIDQIKVRERMIVIFFPNQNLISLSIRKQDRRNASRAWDLRFPNSLKKHQAKVRKILSPNEKAKLSADETISLLREKYDCVVGVHARRGDYKEYLGGIHFHSWDYYRDWIVQTKQIMEGTGKKKVGFLLCSDDDATPSFFAICQFISWEKISHDGSPRPFLVRLQHRSSQFLRNLVIMVQQVPEHILKKACQLNQQVNSSSARIVNRKPCPLKSSNMQIFAVCFFAIEKQKRIICSAWKVAHRTITPKSRVIHRHWSQ